MTGIVLEPPSDYDYMDHMTDDEYHEEYIRLALLNAEVNAFELSDKMAQRIYSFPLLKLGFICMDRKRKAWDFTSNVNTKRTWSTCDQNSKDAWNVLILIRF